ncbi:MAG: hypothetical protein WBD95_18745 [Xanthobacteraceae bacterium]
MAVITTVVDVGSGQTSSGDVVVSPGEFVVSSGGTIVSTVAADGGMTLILDGGIANGTTLQDDGVQQVGGDGMVATAIGTVVASSGEEIVSSGGVTSGAKILAGGTEAADASGSAVGLIVNGGIADIFSGGTASGTTVINGGMYTVFDGGTDSGADVGPGGTLTVSAGGMADNTSVAGRGGTINVLSGGTDSGVTVGSGGTLTISAGGVVNALATNDPHDQKVTAQVTVLSGGTVDGGTKIDGGILTLDAGAVFEPNARLSITHAGWLVLDQDSFQGTIKDFVGSDSMDLSRIRFIGQGPDATSATWTQTNTVGGILDVAQGARHIDLHLTGNYTTGNFGLQSDGVHGTMVSFIPNATPAGHG